MIISKDDIRINGSYYFKPMSIRTDPKLIQLRRDALADPGRVSMQVGFTHDMWKILYRFNYVVDPFEDATAGVSMQIPGQDDLKALKGYT